MLRKLRLRQKNGFLIKKTTYSRNLGQHSIFARKGTFFKYPRLYAIPFLSVLHQNKALHHFRKEGQLSITECNTGLEYALAALLSHVKFKH